MRNRMFLLVVAAVLAVGLAWAGREKGQAGKMGPAEHAAKLKAKLGLTDEQTEKVRAVFEEFQQRIAELKAKAGEQPSPAMLEEKKKLKAERETRLKAIFTAEQYERYQQMMAEQAQKQGQPKH